ncbi:Alpha/Beta hydrolase protein [Mrakia frigida]|uniref:alpha/beta hydrolase family protein n=1 Tax=Mrakia frigida TaxID=29902 RepID=UPI003FCC04AE
MAALSAAGFAVASVNYSGSLGFGEKAVQSLVGECGVLDVSDSVGVVEEWKRLWRGKGDGKGKLFISGGSHGGFLTAHLTSLYPDLFTAAILRNPVTSFGENCTITDIPDWNFGENGLPFSFSSSDPRPSLTPSAEQYALFQSRSPISRVGDVKAATLILMGEEDRRVPPAQTKAWYHSLKGKSDWIRKQNALLPEGEQREEELQVECLVFPGEGHALDGVEAEIVGFEAGLEWFRKLAKF